MDRVMSRIPILAILAVFGFLAAPTGVTAGEAAPASGDGQATAAAAPLVRPPTPTTTPPAVLPTPTAESAPTTEDLPAKGARWPGPRLGLRNIAMVDLQGAYNPLGIQVVGFLVQRNVYEVDEKRDIEWAYLQGGLGAMISPAIAQASLHMEWMPAAVFTLRFQTDVIGYFGTMGALRQFDERPRHFDVDRKTDSLPGHDRSGVAFRVMLQPTLALQVDRFILRSQCNLALYRFVGPGQYFYDYENDTLMAPTELLIFNQTFLLVEAWKAKRNALLYVGALYDVTYAAQTEVRRQRVGAVVMVQPKDPWGPLDRLRIYVMGGVILEDQNRRYEPFLAGGIGTDFDL